MKSTNRIFMYVVLKALAFLVASIMLPSDAKVSKQRQDVATDILNDLSKLINKIEETWRMMDEDRI